ncbi:MAG: ACP S-malonyltransferase [Alphaproteobacteria bacterium]|nr:ACP S-malonyltransferase [Alphaproteobacteria bacterium]
MTQALLFPGQGSQKVGMVSALYQENASVHEVFNRASQIVGWDMASLVFEGPMEKLTQTEFAQPALLTASYVLLNHHLHRAQKAIGDVCSHVAGHSLGEYSALVAAGAIDFEDALAVVAHRGRLMRDAMTPGEGSMIAVIGLSADDLEPHLNPAITFHIANDNGAGQVVLSGLSTYQEDMITLAKSLGAKKCIPLSVSGAFHSPYMQKAADQLADVLNKTTFRKPHVPIVMNVAAKPVDNPSDIKDLLIQQVCGRVRWRESILKLTELATHTFTEVGPGQVLTGLGKRIAPDVTHQSLNLD